MAKKILVLDDEATTITLLESILTKSGYEVVTASNGREGMALIKKNRPDLIISDVLMPEIDGFTFLKALKKDAELEKIPILILTSRKKMEDTFVVLGVDGFLSKPVNTQVLLDMVATKIGKGSSQEQILKKAESLPQQKAEEKKEPPKQEPPPKKADVPPSSIQKKEDAPPSSPQKKADVPPSSSAKRILVAGVVQSVLENMASQLKKAECHVEIVLRGNEFMTKANEVKPDLIILDVLMPELPSKEIIKKLKKDRNLAKKPIIIFSYVDKENLGDVPLPQRINEIQSSKTSCLDAGATEFIGGFEKTSFMSTISKHLN